MSSDIYKKMIFAPYRYAWSEEDGARHDMFLICIKIENIVIKMTQLDKYVKPKRDSDYLYAADEDRVRRVCNFLTHVIFKCQNKYKIKRVTDIPFKVVEEYLKKYAKNKTTSGKYIDGQSVTKERTAISHFMKNLGEERIDFNEHYYARKISVETRSNSKFISKSRTRDVWEYEISAKYIGRGDKNLLRDIPQKAIPIILRAVKRRAPELLFAVLLQLCTGIREGEVVNCRRANSTYPGGIRFVKENGKITSFEVDLNNEYVLRSDGKYLGEIKKKRTQCVYPIYHEVIQEAYEEHLKLIDSKYLERESPLFVNRNVNSKTGKRMAISKQTYCNRIKKIMREDVLPELLRSEESELKLFGILLNEKAWGLHAFRHWFTVQLVLNNEDVNQIAYWRGDSSLDTAFLYLQNKGEIMRRYEKICDIVGNDIVNAIKKEALNVL